MAKVDGGCFELEDSSSRSPETLGVQGCRNCRSPRCCPATHRKAVIRGDGWSRRRATCGSPAGTGADTPPARVRRIRRGAAPTPRIGGTTARNGRCRDLAAPENRECMECTLQRAASATRDDGRDPSAEDRAKPCQGSEDCPDSHVPRTGGAPRAATARRNPLHWRRSVPPDTWRLGKRPRRDLSVTA